MDERRDPGEFYPGGRLIAREGVAPGQTVVNWSDIQGKPDFSDVATLSEEATRGEMKQTMNTVINKLKTSVLIGTLFAIGSALADSSAIALAAADVEPRFAKADDIPGNTPIMTNTQEYVDAKVDSIPAPDFTVSNDTLVATIEAKAPAPGNYAAVSNAAMNAVQRNTFTNDVCNIVTNDVSEYGQWRFGGAADGFSVLNMEYFAGVWTLNFAIVDSGGGQVSTEGAADATKLYFGGLGDSRWVERDRITRNALGLARLTDLPPLTNDLASASLLADIAQTATNAAAAASSASAAATTNSANIATLGAQVTAIGAHINAEDAHFVSTNYDSAVRLPEAYVEIKMRDQATGSNTWITIWQEMRRWTAFVGSAFDWQTWQGFHAWATNITHELSFKADRCWGIYDSETGGYSPEGYTQISSSNILIAAGMAYQRTVTSEGSVWVLQCNQGVAHIGGDTNGFFRVIDGDGNVQFEIIKGDRREMGADATGITVGSGSPPVVTIPYSLEAAEHPTIQVCDNLKTANWKAETDPDCIADVSWSGTSGAYVATVQRKTAGHGFFVKATYMAGGETYIKNVAPISVDGGILCTDGIHKVRPVYNNGTVTLQVVQ